MCDYYFSSGGKQAKHREGSSMYVPSSRTSHTNSLFCACDGSTLFEGDVRAELLLMTLTRLCAPRSFILSFVGERAPACMNTKEVTGKSLSMQAL
jgi:hypothetical protein